MAKLDKIINIGGTDYDVQAKNAEQVDHKLTVKEITGSGTYGYIESQFDGSKDLNISIVSAENGGYFKKPIHVGDVADWNAEELASTVLNYKDISSLIGTFTGSGWYSWDDSKTDNKFSVVTKDNQAEGIAQYLGVVVGKNEDITAFAEYNNTAVDKLPMYLYISNTLPGNLYWGTSTSNKAIQLATISNMVKGKDIEGKDIEYTAASLQSSLKNLDSRINTNLNQINSIKAGDAGAVPAKAIAATKLAVSRNITVDLGSEGGVGFNGESAITTGIKTDCILPTKNGGTGQTDLNNVTVGNASKATSDANGTNIRDNYYRNASGTRSSSETGRRITIDTQDPNSISNGNHGAEGDIWIVYKN